MLLRIVHLGATISRSQIHHSGGIRVDPPRSGEAAIRRPGGSLRRWTGDHLDAYLKESRHLAVVDPPIEGEAALRATPERDGWCSSFVQTVRREPDGSYLVGTEHSRYRVTRVG